ncbi:hypothetical protein B0T17DRAFT_621680 [Bombardia bombarda]|uniref:Uncharacterized protein n=1 Tax=Bombardia bombarda TaxID=252184 RepID=A0AA39W3Q5_9PEZI|nr:hypothetical protein B0T17DRAFT_621680 [Bombardia bombarda]
MANDTILTDDYVAVHLAKDANNASIKYSSMGLEAFRPTKPSIKAKPDTRFLGRIIKQTTNHNAALSAKEAAEAQARLEQLTEAGGKRRNLEPNPVDIRRRQLGAISSILLGGKRKPQATEKGDDGGSTSRTATAPEDSKGKRPLSNDHRRSKESLRPEDDEVKNQTRERRHARKDQRLRERSRSPQASLRKHRHRSPLGGGNDDDDDDNGRQHTRRSRHQSERSGKERASRSGGDLIATRRSHCSAPSRGLVSDPSSSRTKHGRRPTPAAEEEDSDCLEDFIGPAPPSRPPAVWPRGRGVAHGMEIMHSRSSDACDPKSDMQLDPEETDDLDEAVETHFDRQKWKQQGAHRLRAAGFTDEQVKRWEKTKPDGEPDLDDVQWSKAGERREWDWGKEDDLLMEGVTKGGV